MWRDLGVRLGVWEGVYLVWMGVDGVRGTVMKENAFDDHARFDAYEARVREYFRHHHPCIFVIAGIPLIDWRM